jgi:hypothetical protein
MSKPIATLLAAAAFTIGLMSHPGPAGAAPAANALAIGKAPISNLETVRYYGGGWRGGWRGGGWGYYGGGFAAGAILGGMLAAPYYYPQPYYYPAPGYYEDAAPDGAVDYCMRRFRSFDPRSGTYLGNDGRRHPCP